MASSVRLLSSPMAAVLGGLFAVSASWAHAQESIRMSAITHLAKGTFTVDIKPSGEGNTADGVTLGRMSLNKKFDGDLQGTGSGEMLTAMTAVKGSAGYVAIERVTGQLAGRRGSFVFQHTGTMNHGAQQLAITVVPDSATGELQGLSGAFRIVIRDGKHFYEFEYVLPASVKAGG